MGLDMYGYRKRQHERDGSAFTRSNRIHYWRKHYGLRNWMIERFVIDDSESGFLQELTLVDVDELARVVKAGMLDNSPTAIIHYQSDDLAFLRKAHAALAEGSRIYISADW
jgi:hypothetical protein